MMTNFKDIPEVEPGELTLVMSKKEIESTIQLLLFVNGVLTNMAIGLTQEGNEKDAKIITAQAGFAAALGTKLKAIVKVGEPQSRHVH